MVDKIKRVSNPLTIIAIFAGLAEVAATIALGLIDQSIQRIFIWFVMLFPMLLVVSFFIVLWFKPESLYAPSDYTNEENFMKNLAKTNTLVKGVDSALEKISNPEINANVKVDELSKDLNNIKKLANDLSSNIFVVNRNEEKIYRLISLEPGISFSEIVNNIGLSAHIVKNILFNLTESNKIRPYLVGAETRYEIS